MEGWLGAERGGTPCSVDPRPPGAVLRAVGMRSSLPGAAPAPSWVEGTTFPSPRGCWRRAGSSHGLDGCGPFVLDAAQPCSSLPGLLLQLTIRGDPGPTGGSPTCGVTSFLAAGQPLLLTHPLPAPGSVLYFWGAVGLARGSCGGATGLVATGPKGQGSVWLQGTAGYCPMAGHKEVPGAVSQQAGRGGTRPGPRCWLRGGPNPAVVQGPVGPGPYSCAVQSSLAPASPSRVLAAGKGAGISTFGGYFQVLERSRGEMRLSPRRPEKQGPALGNGGLREGREGLSTRPRAHTSAPPLGPSTQHSPTILGGQNPKPARASSVHPSLPNPSCKAGLHCSPWLMNNAQGSP